MPNALTTTALETINDSVEYWEFPDGYSETWEDNATSVNRLFACKWSERLEFQDAIIGTSVKVGNKLRRTLPEEDRYYEGMYAMSMAFQRAAGWPGRSADNDDLAYFVSPLSDRSDDSPAAGTGHAQTRETTTDGLAFYLVSFRRPLYSIVPDDDVDGNTDYGERVRYIVRRREPSAENLPMPQGFLEVVGGSTYPLYTEFAVPFPNSILTYEWLKVPTDCVPFTTIENTTGLVNDATFEGHAAQTLLCLPPKIDYYMDATTRVYYNVLFQFQKRPQGHNKILDAGTATFATMRRKNDTSKGPFLTADFKLLFDPSQS